MKQNLVVFLADLFNVLEINPVKCVRYPGGDKVTTGAYLCKFFKVMQQSGFLFLFELSFVFIF